MTANSVFIATHLLHGDGTHRRLLRAAGFDIRIPPKDLDITQPQQLSIAIGDAEAIVAGTEPYTRTVMEAAPRLRVIIRFGAGYDAVDTQAADALAIAVATTAGTNHEAVAEHALAMLLALARGLPQRDRMVRRGEWNKTAMSRFAGATLGLVGLGRSAQALVRLVSGMGMRILVSTPRPDGAFVAQHQIRVVTLDELLSEADFISLHLPLDAETHNFIDHRRLALVKPHAVLLNVARGGLVNEEALHDALVGGRLAGAGLDVFAHEPCPPDHPLLRLDNVVVSPHVAGLDRESFDEACTKVAHVLIELRDGLWPNQAVVNLRGRTGWHW